MDTGLYVEVQQFYARQMRLLDENAAAEWADTFAPDGVFHQNVAPAPVRGRDAIAVAAQRRVDELKASGLVRRHWLGMLEVDTRPDDTVWTRYYAFALSTSPDGEVQLYVSTVNEDVLHRSGDGWLVKDRRVVHDGHR